MRAISRDAAEALFFFQSRSLGTTKVRAWHNYSQAVENYAVLYLHGNPIAINVDHVLYITAAGWNTLTTRERLNAVTSVFCVAGYVQQKNYEFLINGRPESSRAVYRVDRDGAHKLEYSDDMTPAEKLAYDTLR